MPLNIPNIITLIRLLIIPVMVMFYYIPANKSNEIVTALFVLAGITDWLDGYLARKLDQASPFGAFLDPVADKLIVGVALILLVGDSEIAESVLSIKLFTIVTCVIIGREITISALREWMASTGNRSSVAVGFLGKVKTTAQMISIAMLLYGDSLYGLPIFRIGEFGLYFAAALTLWSMFGYLRAAWPSLTEGNEKTLL